MIYTKYTPLSPLGGEGGGGRRPRGEGEEKRGAERGHGRGTHR